MIPDCKSGRALGLGTGRQGAGDLTQPIAARGKKLYSVLRCSARQTVVFDSGGSTSAAVSSAFEM